MMNIIVYYLIYLCNKNTTITIQIFHLQYCILMTVLFINFNNI